MITYLFVYMQMVKCKQSLGGFVDALSKSNFLASFMREDPYLMFLILMVFPHLMFSFRDPKPISVLNCLHSSHKSHFSPEKP
jgi:hypothetical protein